MECVEWDSKKWGFSYEEFSSGIEEAKSNIEWFFNNLDDLREKYMNKWVAINKSSIVGSGDDLEKLVKSVEHKGIDSKSVEFKFITIKELIRIL